MTPGRLWWLLRHHTHRGWDAWWREKTLLTRIRQWRCDPSWPMQGIPIHVVGGKDHVLMTLWMLASFFRQTQRRWPVVFHEDGTVPMDGDAALLRETFAAQIVTRTEADARVDGECQAFPRLLAMRKLLPLMLKAVDAPVFCKAHRFFLFDPDVLFFRKPDEILAWADADDDSNWFNADAVEPSYLSPAITRERFGFDLWPKVNSGLCLMQRTALDLKFMEAAAEHSPELHGQTWGENWRAEQTLLALCASRGRRGGLLPEERYEVSPGKNRRAAGVARHYIGAVRGRFYAEGLPEVARQLGI